MTGSEAVEPAAQGALSAEHLRGLGMFLSKELKRTLSQTLTEPLWMLRSYGSEGAWDRQGVGMALAS